LLLLPEVDVTEHVLPITDAVHAFPAQIEPFKWAELGFAWRGAVPLTRFKRVAVEVVPPYDVHSIQLDCKLSVDERRVAWLDATLEADLPLICQRCLEGVAFKLDLTVRLALLSDERFLDRLGRAKDEVDYILLSEAQIAHGDTIDVIDLLEDEILLALPLSAKHDDCELKVVAAGAGVVDPTLLDQPKPNPFGMLAGLKLKD
jgi:uncharacterized protein